MKSMVIPFGLTLMMANVWFILERKEKGLMILREIIILMTQKEVAYS